MKEESLILNSFFLQRFLSPICVFLLSPAWHQFFCQAANVVDKLQLALQLGGWLSEAIDLKCLCTLSYLPPPNTIISRPNRPIFVSKGMPGSRQYGDELFIKKMFIQFLCFCFDLLFCSAHQILHLQGFLQDCQLPISFPCSDLPFRQFSDLIYINQSGI